MPKPTSASSYIAQPIDMELAVKGEAEAKQAGDLALAAARAEAIKRLGGEDGLTLVSSHPVEQGGEQLLATTWHRGWIEPDPEPHPIPEPVMAEPPAAPAEDAPAAPETVA